MAKRYLDAKDVPYREIDIEAVPGAAEQVQAWARGYKTVPTFRIGDDGKLSFIKAYDIPTGGKFMWWAGMVALP